MKITSKAERCASIVSAVLLLLLLASSCASGGGTRGTAISRLFTGSITSLSGSPLTGVTVTIGESGDSGVTNDAGYYEFEANSQSAEVEYFLDGEGISASLRVSDLVSGDVEVIADIEIDEERNTAEALRIQVRERERQQTQLEEEAGGASGEQAGSANQGEGMGPFNEEEGQSQQAGLDEEAPGSQNAGEARPEEAGDGVCDNADGLCDGSGNPESPGDGQCDSTDGVCDGSESAPGPNEDCQGVGPGERGESGVGSGRN